MREELGPWEWTCWPARPGSAWKDGWTWMKKYSSSTTRAESQWVSFVRCVDEAAHTQSPRRDVGRRDSSFGMGLRALNEVLS